MFQTAIYCCTEIVGLNSPLGFSSAGIYRISSMSCRAEAVGIAVGEVRRVDPSKAETSAMQALRRLYLLVMELFDHHLKAESSF